MANFAVENDAYVNKTIFITINQRLLQYTNGPLEIIRKTAADAWECKEVPDWDRSDPNAAYVLLQPHWFKTKFWNNKQEKKNPVRSCL